ncbi:alpha/beta fold hydrolase [Falsiroseomonas tokyonensis]|uniref:Alpha/beta fold hydrolase n=1 Tax=Falsiroseomonas tokyonensis TaxID=430521 RepID=A0ABV7BV57_9PROT|nr:alpha/beta fold hydrolase [Falsiroseomonas tokyonensis]MBU8538717.1 alpha/beta fold hydrolase [Falsiroseomonas tokyonensis]
MRLILILGALVLLAAAWWLYTPDRPRAALEASYAAPPSRFLEVAGLRLHLRDTGRPEAPALILLHGFASSLQAWEEVAPMLEADFRVIRLDLPGFGLTGPDPSGDYTDARALAVLVALMDRLGLARAHILGSSMGGRIAWRFAAAHPERVDRLVLMAPDGFASPGIGYDAPPRVPLLLRALPYTLPDRLLRASLEPAYADPATLTPARFATYRDMLLAPGVRQAIVARAGQHVLPPPEPILARISAPTLLLWGAEDRMVPVANAQDYLRALPEARLVVLPGLGHVPMEEAPASMVAPLREFLTAP